MLGLLPWVRRYGLDTAIEQARFPGSPELPALPCVLAFVALKLAGVRRYSYDDQWSTDRGLGLFAGLKVLPTSAWLSSYSVRVVGQMNRRLLAVLGRVWKEHQWLSGAASLDFTTIPPWGEDRNSTVTLQTRGSGNHGRFLMGLSVALARDLDTGLLLCSDSRTRRATSPDSALRFVDFYRENGPALRYLAYDGRFTPYANLFRLNRDGVRFLTVRRRGRHLLDQAQQIPPKDRLRFRVPVRKGTRLVRAHSVEISPRGYEGQLRQITVFRAPSRPPVLLLTNDLNTPMQRILRRYAWRWLVQESISEQLAFFHLNRRSSSMVIKVDFDLTMTLTAKNLDRLLALALPPGQSQLSARSLFERMSRIGATVRLEPDHCRVELKRQLPVLLDVLRSQEPVRIPRIGNRRIVFE